MIIGLTGLKYSGKTEVAEILERQFHFKILSLTDEVSLERDNRGLLLDYDLDKLSIEMRNSNGARYWGERVARRIEDGEYVIEDIDSLKDLEVFRELSGFTLIRIIADQNVRWERCMARKQSDDPKNFQDFIGRCKDDGKGLQSMALLSEVSMKHLIINNEGLDDLYNQVLRIYGFLKSGNSSPREVI